MTRYRRPLQFSLLTLLTVEVGIAFFLSLAVVAAAGLGWEGAVLFLVLTSPFWMMLFYAFNGLVRGLAGRDRAGGSTERLPDHLPPDALPSSGTATGRKPGPKRRRRERRQPPAWYHPYGGFPKQ